jgi:hypothetical protein
MSTAAEPVSRGYRHDPVKKARRYAIKHARSVARYKASAGLQAIGRAKAKARRAARRRLLELDPSQTCVGLVELPGHEVCSTSPIECHHRDGNWRNEADENLAWACRDAHEIFDRILGI